MDINIGYLANKYTSIVRRRHLTLYDGYWGPHISSFWMDIPEMRMFGVHFVLRQVFHCAVALFSFDQVGFAENV